MDAVTAITIAESCLRIGLKGYEMAKRLTAEGYEVPALDEFEAVTDVLRNIPDLAEPKQHEAGGDG